MQYRRRRGWSLESVMSILSSLGGVQAEGVYGCRWLFSPYSLSALMTSWVVVIVVDVELVRVLSRAPLWPLLLSCRRQFNIKWSRQAHLYCRIHRPELMHSAWDRYRCMGRESEEGGERGRVGSLGCCRWPFRGFVWLSAAVTKGLGGIVDVEGGGGSVVKMGSGGCGCWVLPHRRCRPGYSAAPSRSSSSSSSRQRSSIHRRRRRHCVRHSQ